uniref:J domain-containing protein n=1 Tax=Brassica oleracea var. oleracea TaxID=109376 RepID=A0A0D3CW25_BRAOL
MHFKENIEMMSSSSPTQLASLRDMGIYEPFQQMVSWRNVFKSDINDHSPYTASSSVIQVDHNIIKASYPSSSHNQIEAEPSSNDHQEEDDDGRNHDKMKRRLAQNREAARKSRLRKKAYVQQLEESRLKLSQLEQELEKAKQQGVYSSGSSYVGSSGSINTRIAAFELEYSHWLEEQSRRVSEIRTALQAHISDIELKMLVESCLNHYANLFRMKSDAAKADVFYLISGMWRTSTERFFQWIGGFRPSGLLNVVMPYLQPLTDQQILEVRNLQQSSQQAEDALSQGIDKLQQGLAENIVIDVVMESNDYPSHMGAAVENLQVLEGFVNQVSGSFEATNIAANGEDLDDKTSSSRSKDSNFWFGVRQRKTLVRAASSWSEEKSPYDTLELELDAEEEQIKVAYRRLAKYYHPDVYDGKGTLEEGETAESRFIKIQAAYELLMDTEKRRQYDMDNRVNPMKASQAWMEWLMKKRKAFDQRGDMAIAAWAEQQQLEINLRARRLSRSKVDPEEERKLLEKEKKASRELFNSTLKRHTLVLKKRDLMRKKAEEDKKKLITQLLAAEGLELDTEEEEEEETAK